MGAGMCLDSRVQCFQKVVDAPGGLIDVAVLLAGRPHFEFYLDVEFDLYKRSLNLMNRHALRESLDNGNTGTWPKASASSPRDRYSVLGRLEQG